MRLFDLLLFLYPREFRERFAAGMRIAFAEDYARARVRGRLAGPFFLLSTIVRAPWFALIERAPRRGTMRTLFSVDLRDAVRSLRATPVITAVAIGSLALGIGANTALFSILNALVLKPLPVRQPHQLALLDGGSWTNPIWEAIRDRHAGLFAGAFAWSNEAFDLAESGQSDLVDGLYASGGMFDALGVGAAIGRTLTPADDVRGGGREGPVAVISHALWMRRYAGDPGVLGRRLSVNRVPFTIVGVAPKGFFGPEVGRSPDLFLPLSSEARIRQAESSLDARSNWWLEIMIRRKEGQSLEGAAAVLDALRPAVKEAAVPLNWPAEMQASFLRDQFTLIPATTGRSSLRARFAAPLAIVMAVVAAVLLIACANIANVMLARVASRRHEMSLRLALGASRGRLTRQLLVESLLVAAAGGAAGLLVARAGADLLLAQLGSAAQSVAMDVALDWRVLGFTAAVALAATLLFGVAPAIGIGSVEPNESLKEQSRSVAGDRRYGLRSALVVAQLALSLVLIAGAALFLRTFATLVQTPLGFDPAGLAIVTIDARNGNVGREDRARFYQQLGQQIALVPGVRHASVSRMTPMSGQGWNDRVEVPGGVPLSGREAMTWVHATSPGWFETYGMRVLAGRGFTPADTRGATPVVVVNEAFVRRFIGASPAVGRHVVSTGFGGLGTMLIVGVVNDAVYRNVRAGFPPTIYLPMSQAPEPGAEIAVTVRVAGQRAAVLRAVGDAISRADPGLAFSFRDFSDQIRSTVLQERLVAMLSGFFGGLALLLAGLGLYGVTSYSVYRRRTEIAVRMALGANADGVVRLVLGRVGTLLAAGLLAGLALTVWMAEFVGALLFGVEARDPLMLASSVAVLVGVGLLAGWLPARRASRLDPTVILKAGSTG